MLCSKMIQWRIQDLKKGEAQLFFFFAYIREKGGFTEKRVGLILTV